MERLVGTKAPEFKMKAVTGDGKDFIQVNLDDYKGKWLVMFFYPLDFTFVCPTEITGFSAKYEDFKKEGAEILAVSCDSEYSHQAWINQPEGLGQIKFPIASDKTGEVAEKYGIYMKEDGISLRGLFIIDPDGNVKYSVIHDLNVGRSVEETLRVLKAFKTGGLCAINWSEGDPNL
ncbi:redoxin domain-containing protein [Clostridium bovifaecis]|uniref:Redoxin domain-containing protein n=1 Tax=Clostridium bovifaecis TaxID=2184719 RepID=A0A6I6F077_9CLOT|nr:redoxin domain-containing protein [Clostridium bovifaecis]